jgi:hypothetical protein
MIYYHITSRIYLEPKKSLIKKLKDLGAKPFKPLIDRKPHDIGGEINWAIIHSTDYSKELKTEGLDLVIMVSGAFHHYCCLYQSKTGLPIWWKVNCQTVLDNLNSLIKYINEASGKYLAELDPSGWLQYPQNLLALSILCQGYLMVCGNQGQEVQAALKQMGGEPSTSIKYADRQSIVKKSSFWNVFDEKDVANLVEMAKTEWNSLQGDGDLDAVVKLIEAAKSKELVTNASMVASAYTELAKRLGAASGD